MSPPDPPGIPTRHRREPDLAAEQAARDEAARLERAVAQVPKPAPIRIERPTETQPVSTNPFSLFPAAEAARAKVSVSLLLILGVGAVCYWVGSTRHQEKLEQLAERVSKLELESRTCSKAGRVDELLMNVARDQAAMHGRIMQINQDTQVILSKSKD